MANTITGRIEQIGPIEQIPYRENTSTFKKRELTIDATRFDPYTGQRGFDNFPTFEFTGDKCAELDNFSRGQVVTVYFNLQGNKYQAEDGTLKYFTKIRGYKIELKQPSKQPVAPPVNNPTAQQPMPPQTDGRLLWATNKTFLRHLNNDLPF